MERFQLDSNDQVKFYSIGINGVSIDGQKIDTSQIREQDTLYVANVTTPTFDVYLRVKNGFGERRQLQLVVGCNNGDINVTVNENPFANLQISKPETSGIDLITIERSINSKTEPNEVTDLIEYGQYIDVKITFDKLDVGDRVYIFTGGTDDSKGSIIKNITDKAYSRTAKFIQYTFWIVAIQMCFLWLYFQKDSNAFQGILPVILGVLYSVATTFLPSDALKNWSPNEIIRKIHSKTPAKHRKSMVISLVSLSIVIFVFVAFFLRAIWIKDSYISLIKSSVSANENNFKKIADAFYLVPWRRESFLVYELRSKELKTTIETQSQWRSFSRDLIDDPHIQKVINPSKIQLGIDNIVKWILLEQDDSNIVTQDPILAIAQIMAESQPEVQVENLEKAFQLLEKHSSDARARLLKLYFEYDLASHIDIDGKKVWSRTTDEVVSDLTRETDEYIRKKNTPNTQEYLQSIDLIGYHSLKSAISACNEQGIQLAISQFEKVLEYRSQIDPYSSRFTLRSPGKLRIFHLFRFFHFDGDSSRDPIWGQYYYEYKKIFDLCPSLKDRINKILNERDLSKWEKWTGGNPFDNSKYRDFILKEINIGWLI